MIKRLIAYCLLGLILAACGSTAEVPTPLPTAVPPDALPEQSWAVSFQYEFPPGSLGVGRHRYAFLIHCPVMSSEDTNSGWHYFEISEEVVRQPGPLYLRLFGLGADPLAPSRITNSTIHPDRQIIAVVHLVGLTEANAALVASGCDVLILWDNVGRKLLTAGEPFQP